jgi:hypothetical protein
MHLSPVSAEKLVMRLALLICALLAASVLLPLPAHAQGAVLPTMSYYAPAHFTDVVCPTKLGTNTLPTLGLLAFEPSGSVRCSTYGKDQFVIPYNSVQGLVFEDRVREPQSALSRYKVCRSHRLTILYKDDDGRQKKTAVWLPTSEWKLALAVASSKTGLPVERTTGGDW